MRYEDYIANLTGLAVDVVNAGSAQGLPGLSGQMFTDHHVTPPSDEEVRTLLPMLRLGLEALTGNGNVLCLNELLSAYPSKLYLSTHEGEGPAHLHHAVDGEPGLDWLGRCCAAGMAHVACGVPDVTVGKCAAVQCGRFFVDQSRNRSRKFCSNACASRTTVAAYRARRLGRSGAG